MVYSFYHPRDWEDFADPFEQFTHENDMEGMLATVRKDGSTFGRLEAVVAVAHSDFYSYVPAGSTFTAGRENLDGTLRLQGTRPTTRQEAKGHGLYAWNGAEFPGGDGVVYVPSATGEVPSGGNDRSVGYRLVDTFAAGGLWAQRNSSTTPRVEPSGRACPTFPSCVSYVQNTRVQRSEHGPAVLSVELRGSERRTRSF